MKELFITSILPGCRLVTPHECREAEKLDAVAKLLALKAVKEGTKFTHTDKMTDILRFKAEGYTIHWVLDEASLVARKLRAQFIEIEQERR